jgi:hypothetical protein
MWGHAVGPIGIGKSYDERSNKYYNKVKPPNDEMKNGMVMLFCFATLKMAANSPPRA